MGRELKRVPPDFDWPLNKNWAGYLNPYYTEVRECDTCGGTGYSEAARELKDKWYGYRPFRPEERGSTPFQPTDPPAVEAATRNVENAPEYYGTGKAAIAKEAERLCEHFNSRWLHHLSQDDVDALLTAGRLMDFTRVPLNDEQREDVAKKLAGGGNSWLPYNNGYHPTAAEVNLWSLRGFGHDSCNQHIVVKAECERIGQSTTCGDCNGEGSLWSSKSAQRLADEWQRVEPPSGDGYQIWQTVSEGAPISPVFGDPHDLATWMAQNPWGADQGTTAEQWLRFILGPGWAPSLVGQNGRIMSGVEVVTA